MVRRLVEDMIRRTPVKPLAYLAIGLALAWGALASSGRRPVAIAISLAAVYVLGPVVMVERLRTPLVTYLPVSRRDVWRATWLMSTLAPTALMVAIKLPATLTASAATWSSLTLSTVMELLYAGTGCALIAAGDTKRILERVRWIVAVLLLVGTFLPFAGRAWLPAQWSDVRPVHGLLFGIGLGLTWWGWRHTPTPALSRRRGLRIRAASSTAVVSPVRPARLSGLPQLLAHELAFSMRIGALMTVVFLGVAFIVRAGFDSRPTIHQFLVGQTMLVFDANTLKSPEFDLSSPFGWYAFYLAAVSFRFSGLLRHLRVLPLGTGRLHVLLLAWPALIWSAAWLLLAGLQWAMNGPRLTAGYQLPLFFACVALSALGIAMGLRFRWGPTLAAPTLPLLFPVWHMADMSSVWLVAIGMTSFLVAAALNVNALSRGATYKRIDPLALRIGAV